MPFCTHSAALCLLLSVSIPSLAQPGGVSLNLTRIIFSAKHKAQTVTVSNTSSRTYLIQSQVQADQDGKKIAPFIATPPLFSLKGDSRHLLRILQLDNTLPDDRESLFYLVVSAIPSQTTPVPVQDRVSVGLRFILKLFYRPTGLEFPPEGTPCRLTFSHDAKGIRVDNPTPYFQTLGALSLGSHAIDIELQPSMVAPQGSLYLTGARPGKQVHWQTITEHGGLSEVCRQAIPISPEVIP